MLALPCCKRSPWVPRWGDLNLKAPHCWRCWKIKNLSTVAEGCALITRCKRCPAEIIEVALDCLKASLVPTVQARRSQVFLSQSQSLAFPRCHRAARAQGPQSSRSSTRTACLHDQIEPKIVRAFQSSCGG